MTEAQHLCPCLGRRNGQQTAGLRLIVDGCDRSLPFFDRHRLIVDDPHNALVGRVQLQAICLHRLYQSVRIIHRSCHLQRACQRFRLLRQIQLQTVGCNPCHLQVVKRNRRLINLEAHFAFIQQPILKRFVQQQRIIRLILGLDVFFDVVAEDTDLHCIILVQGKRCTASVRRHIPGTVRLPVGQLVFPVLAHRHLVIRQFAVGRDAEHKRCPAGTVQHTFEADIRFNRIMIRLHRGHNPALPSGGIAVKPQSAIAVDGFRNTVIVLALVWVVGCFHNTGNVLA
ncbi:hypothetical protein D3C73_811060 [compost metagenome]